jgi:recombination protein RecA
MNVDDLIKKGLLRKGSDPDFHLLMQPVSTGLPRLDAMLGGGLLRSRIVEFVGPYSGGKSFIGFRCAMAAQKAGLQVAWIDTEHSWDPDWATRIGVDVETLQVAVSSNGEETIDIVTALLDAKFDVVVVDSLTGMIPNPEIEASAETQFMQLFPRLISKAIRKWMAANKNSCLILINQVRAMGVIPGGDAQAFAASAILDVKRAGWITEGDETTGYYVRLVLRKSKQSRPWTEMSIPFMYNGFLDEIGADIDFAVDTAIIGHKGAFYYWGEMNFKGRHKVVQYFKEHKDEYEKLITLVKTKMVETAKDTMEEAISDGT